MDKRRFPRAFYQCLITLGKKGGRKMFLTHTENIGVGGIAVILEEELGRFSKVDIELMLKDGQPPIKCAGNVVWTIKRGELGPLGSAVRFDTGIEFYGLKDSEKARIAEIVDCIVKGEDKKAGR